MKISNLLGCDMYYKTAGVSAKEYRGLTDIFSKEELEKVANIFWY